MGSHRGSGRVSFEVEAPSPPAVSVPLSVRAQATSSKPTAAATTSILIMKHPFQGQPRGFGGIQALTGRICKGSRRAGCAVRSKYEPSAPPRR